jgi:hypothetical protein
MNMNNIRRARKLPEKVVLRCWRRYLYLGEKKKQDGENYIIRVSVIFVLNTLLW